MPTTVEALIVIALVLAPGYVVARTTGRVISQVEEPPDLRFLLTAITWGMLVHALMSWWSSRILDFYLDDALAAHRWEALAWGVTTIVFGPFLLGILGIALLRVGWVDRQLGRIGLSAVHRTPTAWQYVIRKARPAYVRVHLKDGETVIGGCYSVKSFTSGNPKHGDLFLETRWLLDENNDFDCAVSNSEGVWITHDVISHVEFLAAGTDGAANDVESIDAADASAHTNQAGPRLDAGQVGSIRRPGLPTRKTDRVGPAPAGATAVGQQTVG